MGLSYTIDTPIKVARFGIDSAVSIIHDHLVEKMRKHYFLKTGRKYEEIKADEKDHRARRITSFLNMMHDIIEDQMKLIRKESFEDGSDSSRYFGLLPESSDLKKEFHEMQSSAGKERIDRIKALRKKMLPGKIDVNIMTKLDKLNLDKNGENLPVEYADAMAALRGFAKSKLSSSVIFSAGLNPRLFAYIEEFKDFFPNESGYLKKKIILKVSDYRSALIQGKFLAKKGIWISEFRIESGLNCGGHAFPTEGILLGPILEEFKLKREELRKELFDMCNEALKIAGKNLLSDNIRVRITYQGGIGTSDEDNLLRSYYSLDGTGWGSPFLLVPEATTVDEKTRHDLVMAQKEDYFMSYASPLGIPFNNFRKSSSELQRLERIEKNRPGSPCHSKFLAFNTEFSSKNSLCVASREYQRKKIKELDSKNLAKKAYDIEYQKVVEKDCLCEGLSVSALIDKKIPISNNMEAVTICPGPNLAFFSKTFTLEEMVGHIYGRMNVLNQLKRPHVFFNEVSMYFDYMKSEIERSTDLISAKQSMYFRKFKENMLSGIDYYKTLLPKMYQDSTDMANEALKEWNSLLNEIEVYCTSKLNQEIFVYAK